MKDSKKAKKRIGWGELPRVHILAIIDFHRNQKEENGILNHQNVVETYRFSPEISASNNHIFDHWKATIVDLKKFKSKPVNNLKTDKEKWIFLLNDAPSLKKEEVDVLKKDPVFQVALERLERLSSDPTTRQAYEVSVNEQRDHLAVLSSQRKEGLAEGFQEGHQKGVEEGRQEGREKEKLNIALKMLDENIPIDKISSLTGLREEDLKKLQK